MNVAIIGGGACGLLLGSYLQRQKIQYTIFEKENAAASYWQAATEKPTWPIEK